MKSILHIFIVLSLLLSLQTANAQSGEKDQDTELIRKAMKDELKRNMDALVLETLERPCFLSYTISDASMLSISATLGAIIKSEQLPYRSKRVRVLVGDYQCTNENFVDITAGSSSSIGGFTIPLENDYVGIRRSLWKETDEQYKKAAEMLELKRSAMKQQNLSPEAESLPDFIRAKPAQLQLEGPDFAFNKVCWEKTARELSAVFKTYHDIFASRVTICFYRSDVYYVNSEGTETKYPISIAALSVTAETQADDGEPLLDYLLYCGVTSADLPSPRQMKEEIKIMADQLVKLRRAPIFDDSYSGPVLFEGQAVAEAFSQRFFKGALGLRAKRVPLFGQAQIGVQVHRMMSNSLQDKIGKKIMADSLTIKAAPRRKEYKGQKLVGYFEVDAEGVIPPNELVLVEKGVLKTLLNGRSPTKKIRGSNGHKRCFLQSGSVAHNIGPGVIEITTSEGSSKETLKKQLIQLARKEGLDYAIVIRKIPPPKAGTRMSRARGRQDQFFQQPSQPIYAYRVSLEDGSEQLLRTTELSGISFNDFKRIEAVSKKSQLYTTMLVKNGFDSDFSNLASGMPTSFIVPDAMIFKELELSQHRRAITNKPPVVENPVGI